MFTKTTVALGFTAAIATNPVFAENVQLSDSLTIHYETSGKGSSVILFVPGWAMSTEVFEHQLAAFEGSDEYTFVTYDPRGQGESSKTRHGHYYQQRGQDLNDFISALDLDNIVLAGWSYGGLDVLSYVNQFGTDKLAAFSLIDAAPKSRGQDSSKEWVWYRYDDADGFEAFFTMGPLLYRDELLAGFADWMFADKSEENLNWAIEIAEKTDSTTMALLNAAGAHDDFTDDLKKMDGQTPLFYIVREEWGPVVSDWAATNTPSATISATMPSHLGFWEDPDGFNAELMKFLASIE